MSLPRPAGWRVLAVAVLAVLAGCGGVGPAGGGDPTPTLTPAPVPDEAVDAPPGIAVDGIDGETVTRRHEAALANRSYTVVETLRVGPAGNASFHARTVRRVAASGTPLRVDETISATRNRYAGRGTDVWWNGQRATYRFTFSSGRHTYYYTEERPSGRLYIDGKRGPLLSAVAVRDVAAGDRGTAVVRGYVENASVLPQPTYVSGIANGSASVRVRESGVIDRIAVGYDARYADRDRTHVRYTYRVTDVGTTSVRPPVWLQNATLDAGE